MPVSVEGYQYYGGYGSSGWVPPFVPNAVNDLILTPSDSVVTVDEIKTELKIDFNDEDDYIADLITLCQARVESFCGVSMSTRTLQAVICNNEGNIEIPYGPIISITSAFDQDGNDITTILTTLGISFKTIRTPNYQYINLTYVAGYASDNLPLDLKKAIKQEIAFRYRYRTADVVERLGQNPGLCEDSAIYATPFKRMRFI